MINLTTNTKSFSVEKGTAGGKSGSGGSSSKVIKQIIYQGGSGSGESSGSTDVFTGATETNAGRQGLVPQPLAGQNTLVLKGNGLWDKVFKYIREDEDGNIYIDGKATKFGSPVYLDNIYSNQNKFVNSSNGYIEFHDTGWFDRGIKVNNNATFFSQGDFYDGAFFSRYNIDNDGNFVTDKENMVDILAELQVENKSRFTDDMTATSITVDYLTVTKLAHFFKLMIDQVKASKGQIIITDANAKIDFVESYKNENNEDITRLWWKAQSDEEPISDHTQTLLNEFEVDDQILCQTLNTGTANWSEENPDLKSFNKYYWVVCIGVGNNIKKDWSEYTPNYNLRNGFYNYVDIKESGPCDGEFTPAIGDEIVQLGNRSDTTRQAAIIISAYNNAYLDKEIKAPAIVQYDGINDFQIEKHRLNVISKGFNRFMGSYLTPDGKTDIVDKFGDIETTTSNRFSEIQQTIDGITTKVSNNKTSIDTLTGKVTTNEENISKLDQKADRIQAQVEQNQTSISGDLTTINNNIANLQVKADGIQTTVSQHTTKIDDLTGKVTENTTNISKIDQKADSIQSTVTKIDGDYVTSSQLTQTSTEILAQVSNTYIKINDGKVIINAAVDEKTGEIRDDIDSIKRGNIELNGNTTINGNLTIQNATDGLTLVGTGGTTEIRSKDIGNFFDYIKNPEQYFEAVQTSGAGMQMYQDGNSYKEMFVNDNVDAKQTISIPANTQVLWDNTGYAFAAQSRYNMGFVPNVVHEDNSGQMRIKVQTPDGATTFIQFTVKELNYIWTFVNEETGALIHSDANVIKGSFDVGANAIPKCRVRIQIYVKVDRWEVWKNSWSYNGKNYTLSNNSKVQTMDWVVPIPYTFFTLVSKNPEVNNLIGYNGQAFNFGGGNGLFIGQKGLQAKYGDYCFMINPQQLEHLSGVEGETAQYYPKGIWEINKTTFTHATGPFNKLETATSEYITMGRSFGSYNVRHVTSSGNICVLPEDDIIVISQIFTSINANIDVTVIFPPGNDGSFNGHIVKVVHIQRVGSNTESSVTVKTSDNFYPIYHQDGSRLTSFKLNYAIKTFVQVGAPMMGHWITE